MQNIVVSFVVNHKQPRICGSEPRKSQVGSGDRSEKIRTYNYPQGRVTDHRIGLTIHALEKIMQGDIDQIIIELEKADQKEKMKKIGH